MKIILPGGTITAQKEDIGYVAEFHDLEGDLLLDYHSPEEDQYDAFCGIIADILLEPEYQEYRLMVIDALANSSRQSIPDETSKKSTSATACPNP